MINFFVLTKIRIKFIKSKFIFTKTLIFKGFFENLFVFFLTPQSNFRSVPKRLV